MTFWLYDPTILLQKNNFIEVIPNEKFSMERNLNAITRLTIYITFILYIIFKKKIISFISFIFISSIIIGIYNKFKFKKEGFSEIHNDNISYSNPFNSNILNTNTNKQPVKHIINSDNSSGKTPSYEIEYNSEIENNIHDNVKKMIKDNNKDNSDIDKLFYNESDNIDFENHMRQFYIQPIDNNLSEFLSFCYGSLPSNKSIISY
tara:strand:+ start:7951 stop:8565 length:615 start_codon:yes stop_codon:yes gene_type:complete